MADLLTVFGSVCVCVALCSACYNGSSLQIKEFGWVDEHNPLLVNLFFLRGHVLCVTEYDMIWWWYLFNRSWVDTRWQHHTTHLQQTIHTIHREYNSGSAGRAPSLRVIPWHLPYNWGKSTEKTSVRVAQYKNNEQAPEPWNTIP